VDSSGAATTAAFSNPGHPSAFAFQQSPNVEYVGHMGGSTYAIAVHGNYAYVGEGPCLVVMDVSNPAAPVVVGRTLPMPDIVFDIVVAGDFAYVADIDGGLRVVSLADPSGPVEVGFYDTPGEAVGVDVGAGYAYIADNFAGLRVVDIRNPTAPVEVGFYKPAPWITGVALKAPYIYLVDSSRGLHIVDISNPAVPNEVGYVGLMDAYGVAVSGNYAYVAAGTDGLRVVDISNPSSPAEVGFCNPPYAISANYVTVNGHYAYVAGEEGGMRVMDITDPTAPAEAGFYNTRYPDVSDVRKAALSGGHAYLADAQHGLVVIDITNPAAPAITGSYSSPQEINAVALSEDRAYLADNAKGLSVVSLADPSAPVILGTYSIPVGAAGVAVRGTRAYVVQNFQGDFAYGHQGGDLCILDESDPAASYQVGCFGVAEPGYVMDAAISGNHAYIAASLDGLRVWDISNPVPVEIGFSTEFLPDSVIVSGNYAYTWGYGWRVIDITNPASPAVVGGSEMHVQDIAVAGDYAYVAEVPVWNGSGYTGGGLHMINVANPDFWLETGLYTPPRRVLSSAAACGVAYVAESPNWDQITLHKVGGGLHIISFADPAAPTELGYYQTPGYTAKDVLVSGNYLYLADGHAGLFILRLLNDPCARSFLPMVNKP
jgi:hypothetical protein